MSAIWFLADLHVGHRMVAGLRGFGDDIDAHDTHLAGEWDKRIRADDQVWVLGDVTGRRGDEQRGLDWIGNRPGIKHLISGNHDACHPMHSQAHKVQQDYLKVFASVQSAGVRKIAGQRVRLSHFPYEADHTSDARYRAWRISNDGEWLIHGHTHSRRQMTSSREIHVGVDAHNLAPVSLHWIEDRINEEKP